MSGRWGRRILALVSVAALAVGVTLAGTLVAGAAQGVGQVYIVHAIDGVTADVYLDGNDVRAAALPKTIVGPLALAPGSHVLAMRRGSTVLVTARFAVAAGQSLDVVAHLMADAGMADEVTVFTNDLSPVPPGKGRLVVSHVAVAPPADIRVDGKPLFRNVANGESLSLIVPAQTYSVDVVPTATTGPVILAPVRVTVGSGTLTRVFAIGDPARHTADAILQAFVVPIVGAPRPTMVRTGDGGQAAESFVSAGTGPAPWSVACLAVGLLALALSRRAGRVFDPRRRSRHAR